VFLLFAGSGAVAWDHAAEHGPDHKCLRINVLCAVANTGSSSATPGSIPRPCTRDGTTSGVRNCLSLPEFPASCGTLLSLGSLLSV
jgi:hypothetical protein